MGVFTLLFGRWAKMPSDGVPYPLFAFAALLPWTFFANAVSASANSLVGNTHLISKVYFPRLLIALSSIGTALLDLGVAMVVMFALLAFYGVGVTSHLAALPALVLVTLLLAFGVGSALAALCAIYRDVRYVVPFLLQLWMFASPVIYPVSLIPAEWRWLAYLNPMVGAIDGFRSALLGLPFNWIAIGSSYAITLARSRGRVVVLPACRASRGRSHLTVLSAFHPREPEPAGRRSCLTTVLPAVRIVRLAQALSARRGALVSPDRSARCWSTWPKRLFGACGA